VGAEPTLPHARQPAPGGARERLYTRRRPEESVLYGVVQAELEGFLAHGFVRVRCEACASERVVAFACKGRGFCPSCGGRRMADTAAHLVDRVLPEVPVRQWVLSLPFALRYRLAFDGSLTTAVLDLFVRTVFASLRRRSRLPDVSRRSRQCGAITFVQRFGDALNLNVHFHSLVLDGVYAQDAEGRPRFHPLPPPEDAEVERVARQIARRIARPLKQRGLHPEPDSDVTDPLPEEQPFLATLYAASVAGRATALESPIDGHARASLRFGSVMTTTRGPGATAGGFRGLGLDGWLHALNGVHVDVDTFGEVVGQSSPATREPSSLKQVGLEQRHGGAPQGVGPVVHTRANQRSTEVGVELVALCHKELE